MTKSLSLSSISFSVCDWLQHPLRVSHITSDLPANQRYSLYSSGNPFFITPRILIVDLLTQRSPVSSLAGIFILNAHSLSETSTEAFIVRVVKTLNASAYVRAFSDRLQAIVRYDAVSFLKFLDTLRVPKSYRSVWLFAESSYKILERGRIVDKTSTEVCIDTQTDTED